MNSRLANAITIEINCILKRFDVRLKSCYRDKVQPVIGACFQNKSNAEHQRVTFRKSSNVYQIKPFYGRHDSRTKYNFILHASCIAFLTSYFIYDDERKYVQCEGEPIYIHTNEAAAKKSIQEAIAESKDLVQRKKDEVGSPGIVVAVSVDGQEVWSEGIGYADVENRVMCKPNTVMRIASISKPIAMTIAGKLYEEGKLDFDKNIKDYVKVWPEKTFDGEKVEMTFRQLVSHQAGIRHYDRECTAVKNKTQKNKQSNNVKDDALDKQKSHVNSTGKEANKTEVSEFELREYYIKRRFPNVTSSLNLFKDDKLCFKPGTNFLYSSHGWTLASAAMESASGKTFPQLAKKLFSDLGMDKTYLDQPEPIIYNRSSYYIKNKKGILENAPYVDNSYKWAGGGLLSTVQDLCKFGDSLLYCYQYEPNHGKPGYLKPETMKEIWKPIEATPCGWDTDGHYALGWCSIPEKESCEKGKFVRQYMSHTGGAIGASSVLLVMPRRNNQWKSKKLPQGISVAIITNLQSVSMNKTALAIAKIFEEAV